MEISSNSTLNLGRHVTSNLPHPISRSTDFGEVELKIAPGMIVAFAHLIDAFVLAEYRDRVRAMVRRGSWLKVSTLIEQRMDPRRCRLCDEQSRPDEWPRAVAEMGVYMADVRVGLTMSVADASSLSIRTCSDAVLSIVPGRLAVFLNHEWGVWYCEALKKQV